MVLLSTCVALLVGANPHLDEGRRLVRQVDYPAAEAHLRLATQMPGSTVDERREITHLLAKVLVAQGKDVEAESTFLAHLSRDPGLPDPDDSPKIREVYLRAKRRLFSDGYVQFSPPTADGRIALIDPWRQVVQVRVHASAAPDRWHQLEIAPAAEGLRLDALPMSPSPRRFHLEALGSDGQVLAVLGSREAPLEMTRPDRIADLVRAAPAPAAVTPDVRARVRWPAWTLLGTAVVAAGTGAALAASSSEDVARARAAGRARDATELDRHAWDKAIAANVLIGGAAVLGAGAAIVFWRF